MTALIVRRRSAIRLVMVLCITRSTSSSLVYVQISWGGDANDGYGNDGGRRQVCKKLTVSAYFILCEQSDTTKFQTNYYNRPSTTITEIGSGNEEVQDLGFDAANAFHVYGFKWLPGAAADGSQNRIEWEVDGVTRRTVVSGTRMIPVPTARYTYLRILSNVWPVSQVAFEWARGAPAANISTSSDIMWIRYTALDANGQCQLPTTC
jgi:beta-glucanase (GH16 family)